jgi:hypothetical protein
MLRSIRIVSGEHDIDCKIDAISATQLKSDFVKYSISPTRSPTVLTIKTAQFCSESEERER